MNNELQNRPSVINKIDSLREKLGCVYSSKEIAEYLCIDETPFGNIIDDWVECGSVAASCSLTS